MTRNTLHRYEIETKYHYECQTPGCTYLHKRHGRLPSIEKKRCPLCRGVLLQTKPAVKALSAYNVFAKENISRIARENPNTPRKELWTILGQDWKKHQQGATPGVELNGNVETDEVEGKYHYTCQSPGCQYLYKRQTKLPDMEKRICPLCGAMLLQIKPAPKASSAQDPFTKGNTSRRTPLTELSADGQMGATQESPVKARSRTEVIVLTESDDDLETRIASLKVRRPKSPLPLPLRSSCRTMAAVILVCMFMVIYTLVSVGWAPEQTKTRRGDALLNGAAGVHGRLAFETELS